MKPTSRRDGLRDHDAARRDLHRVSRREVWRSGAAIHDAVEHHRHRIALRTIETGTRFTFLRTGVARIGGRNFSGFLAWWMWRTIYLAKLPRWEKRLRVMLDWTLDLFCGKDLVQFQTGRAAELGQVMREEMGVGAAAAGATGLAAAAPAHDAADAACTVERRAS